MRPVREIYRRLDVIQRKRFFRVALSVVVLLSFVGTIIPLTLKSRDLLVQRVALYEVLAGGSLATGDHVATTFAETGTVEAGGRVYGDESFIRRAPIYFDEQGVLVGAARLTVDLLVDQRPAGVPDFLLEDPVTVVFLG